MSEATLNITDAGGFTRNAKTTDFNPCIFWNETTTALGVSAAYTGASRDVGTTATTPSTFGSFSAFCVADQAGTLKIQGSNNGSTWYDLTPAQAVTASTPLFLTVPVLTRYHRVVMANSTVAQGSLFVNSGYSA